MRWREFMKVIAGTAAAWPLAAFAQQSERVRRIGVLAGGNLDADDLDLPARIGAFDDGRRHEGHTQACYRHRCKTRSFSVNRTRLPLDRGRRARPPRSFPA